LTQKIKQKRIRGKRRGSDQKCFSTRQEKKTPSWLQQWMSCKMTGISLKFHSNHSESPCQRKGVPLPAWFLHSEDIITAPLHTVSEREWEREREMWIYIYIHVCVKGCWLCIEVIIGYAKQPKRGGNRPLKPSVSLWEHSLVLSNQSYHSTEETLPNKESWKRLLW
jgi:hypothetical protein